MKVASVNIYVVDVPQIEPVKPYRSRVRTSSTTCSGIAEVRTDDGLTGWGEFNLNFLPGISAVAMQRDATDWLVGRDPRNIQKFHVECPWETRLKSGVEMALWDIAGQAAGRSLAELLGGVVRPRVELAACMGIQSYERARELAQHYVAQGYSTLKAKAGADMEEDLEMVRGVRDAVGDKLHLRIDPNRGYTREQSAELARRLEPYRLQYLEQPLPEAPLSDAAWLRKQTTTPIALNESVVDPHSVIEILRENAAEFILPDTHIAGGILPCVVIGQICQAAGVPCIMHCGHDLGPKTAAMVHIAAALPAYSLANDSTYCGLVEDITRDPLQIERGSIAVPAAPGLGVAGDLERIRKYLVDC